MWEVRLLLAVALLGMLLLGAWPGEVHSHDNGSTAHSHEHGHSQDRDTAGNDPQPDGTSPGPLHFHDATVALVMPGPAAHGTELPQLSAGWAPDAPAVHAPLPSFNAPHRPPIV